MIWFFERRDESLRVETRYDNATAEYVLVQEADHVQQVETFKDVVAFRQRLGALEAQLSEEHWTTLGPPVLVSEGWKET